MNKIILKFALLIVPILFAPLAFGATSVSAIKGAPQIMRSGQTLMAQPGTACQNGDILKTTSGCQMDVTINGLAGCRVLPSSECELTHTETDSMYVRINAGNAIFNLRKLPSSSEFKVETPSAIAAVRGTQFWGRVNQKSGDDSVTTFAVRTGSVQITDKQSSVTYALEKGQALDIPKLMSDAHPAVREALPEELKAMEQASSISLSA